MASGIGKIGGTLSLMSMQHARQHDNVLYLVIQHSRPQNVASMPSVRRDTRGASAVRWYAHVRQPDPLHARQWVGTYAGRGNGDYQGELTRALRAISTYLQHFDLTPQAALVRLDGQYGNAVVMAQLIEAGVCWITRGRTYGMLKRPQLQRVLAHPPSARVTALQTGAVVELFALWLASPRPG